MKSIPFFIFSRKLAAGIFSNAPLTIMLAAVWLEGPPVFADPNLLVNGSFEQPVQQTYTTLFAGATNLLPWVIGTNSVDIAGTNNGYVLGPAYDGSQTIDMDGGPGPGQLSQTFNTSSGQNYYVSFAYANNYVNQPSASMQVRIYDADGNRFGPLTVTHSGSAAYAPGWILYTNGFTGSGKPNTIEFTSLSAAGSFGGILLDAVTVSTNPPPTPVVIFAAAVSGNNFTFSVHTVDNQSYTIQQNLNLTTTNWTYCTNFVGDGSVFQYVTPLAGSPRRFFRVLEP